jgi:hypothetical protein
MKLLFALVGLLFSISLSAENIVIERTCNIMNSSNYMTSRQVISKGRSMFAFEGEVYKVLDKYGDYVLLEGYGKMGFVWINLVNIQGTNATIGSQGAYLNKNPDKKSTRIGTLRPGLKMKYIMTWTTWYKIEQIRTDIIRGWVNAGSVRIQDLKK